MSHQHLAWTLFFCLDVPNNQSSNKIAFSKLQDEMFPIN
jgi:hypothetical protein